MAEEPLSIALQETSPLGRAADTGRVDIVPTLLAGPSDVVSSSTEPALRRGDLVGRYLIVSTLGEGGMGIVYVAYDPELDRRVAIKLIRSELAASPHLQDAQAGLLREAQALARLSHPNVVGVHDVGTIGGQVWLAMELIDGQTLTSWLKKSERGWREIVAAFCEAGRGLQAAHEVGLVHGDFKPDNVMIGVDRRIYVMDFGLARQEKRGRSEPVPPELVNPVFVGAADKIARTGVFQGTPAYMAPEQWSGGVVGTYSDQFSFCVALYEALYGKPPFAGTSLQALRAAVMIGWIQAAPPRGRVPSRILHILRRGLAVAPEQRWPSMAALLQIIDYTPRRTYLQFAGVAGLLAIASAVSYGVAKRDGAKEGGCELASRELEDVWNTSRKKAMRAAFVGTHASFAEEVWRRAEGRLDAYSEAWIGEHKAACESHAAGIQTGHVMDLRIACLGRHRARLRALFEVFESADQAVVEGAVQAVAALPSVSACSDAEALLAVPPPSDPQMVQRVDQLRQQLAQVEALEHTGRFEQGLSQAVKVRTEAATLGYAPLDAEAALSEGSLLMAAGRAQEADTALIRAIKLGIVNDLRGIAGEAAAKRIYVLSMGMQRNAEALAIRPVAEALVERVRDDGRLVALLHNNLGVAYTQAGEYPLAQEQFEQTVKLLWEQPGAPDPLIAVTLHNLGDLYLKQKRLDTARMYFAQAREQFNKILGETHPFVAHPIAGLGELDLAVGRYEDAIQNFTEALRLMEMSYGADHPYLMQPLLGLGQAFARLGRTAEARANLERAVAVADRLGLVDEQLGRALEELGELAAATDPARARGLFERAVEVHAGASGKDSAAQARAMLRAGELAAQLNEPKAAMRWFERVLELPASAEVTVRPVAAVQLAKQLTDQPEAVARMCDLLAEARLSLIETDPLRGEAEVLQASRCGGPVK